MIKNTLIYLLGFAGGFLVCYIFIKTPTPKVVNQRFRETNEVFYYELDSQEKKWVDNAKLHNQNYWCIYWFNVFALSHDDSLKNGIYKSRLFYPYHNLEFYEKN